MSLNRRLNAEGTGGRMRHLGINRREVVLGIIARFDVGFGGRHNVVWQFDGKIVGRESS
jgi:hypothetical protein